jgi:hypothetical protein
MEDRELDPVRDPGRWESIVATVMAESRPELARLRGAASPSAAIAGWWQGVMAGAGSLATAAAVALLMVSPPANGGDDEEVPLVAAAISSDMVAAWLLADEMPTAEELLTMYEGGTQ